MSQVPAYEAEPYRTELPAHVLRVAEEGARIFAVLDDTILYPEGGGQPPDHGFLDETAVVDVQKKAGETRHYITTRVPPGPATVRLDWRRRFDHMQQHTGQHLLTAVAQDLFGWETQAFHLGAAQCDIELAAAGIPPVRLEELEDAVAAEIRAARPVTARRVTGAEYATLSVRSRGLPEGHEGEIRLIEIAGRDVNTCGGTHLASTSEIELVKLLGTEALRGGTRLFFAAGSRARRRFSEGETRCAALRAVLGAPDEGLIEAARLKLEQLAAAERRARSLEDELAEAAATSLAAADGAAVSAHFDGKDLSFLQKLSKAFVEKAPGKAVLLTASSSGQHVFLVAAGETSKIDVTAAGREIAALLGGRGGGSGRVFQGKAGSLADRARAFEKFTHSSG
jgi:alanyl-tRNA synthetase